MYTAQNLPILLYHLDAAHLACETFSISPRTIKGHRYYYRQWTENGKRKQKIIPKENVEADLAAFAHKQKVKKCRREARAALQAQPDGSRRLIRQKTRLLAALDQIPGNLRQNQYLDGSLHDSKNELIISLLLDLFAVKYEHHNVLGSPDRWMESDFTAEGPSGKVELEHAGMLDVKTYLARLCEKVKIYDGLGYRVGKNLIITRDHFYFDENWQKRSYLRLPEIAWKLVSYDLVKPNRLLRFIKKR